MTYLPFQRFFRRQMPRMLKVAENALLKAPTVIAASMVAA
jgi:hypothetical protein